MILQRASENREKDIRMKYWLPVVLSIWLLGISRTSTDAASAVTIAQAQTGTPAPPAQIPAATRETGPPEPFVSTFAGDGRLGAYVGTTTGATFIFPYGVAVGPDGTVYVADAGAEAIREIKDGNVTSLAGDAPAGPTPLSRVGAYLDGPGPEARFNWPTGVAVARNGAVYVADSANYCIRKIENGVVTTFAGSPARGDRDGPASEARFHTPESLAFDGDGNLYVADFGNGLRKITPAGNVSTLHLPSKKGEVLAVAARGAGASLVLAYTENSALHLIEGTRMMVLATGDLIEPWEELRTARTFYSVAILGPGTVAVTDVLDNAVRLVRFPGPPFYSGTMSIALGGGRIDGVLPRAGFRDGPRSDARFDVPLGIARMPNGDLLVADAGNRRIRKVSNVDPRGPALPDLSNLSGPRGAYRVALLGNSFLFHDVLWSESIPGQIEFGLRRDGPQVGLDRKPFLAAVRLDDADVSDMRSFIRNYLADGEADLVVVLIEQHNHARELERRPDLTTNDRGEA